MKKLGFGLMRLPMQEGKVDVELTKQMVDEFMKQGFTYFDTAWMYCDGTSENVIKECLVDRYPRDSYTLTDKLPGYEIKSLEDRDRIFNKQKEKTGLDYFDYYWLHAVSKQSIETFDKYDCWQFIIDKKAKGEVKHIGFSYHDDAQMLEELLIKHPEIEYVQLQLNYLDYESDHVQSGKCYEICKKYGKPVIVMEPVKGGTLVGVPSKVKLMFNDDDPKMSIASYAIRFAASLDNVYMVLSGMSNMEQLQDNLSYMKEFKPLSEAQMKMCLDAGDIIRNSLNIPCTACRYCTVNCPTNIDIPHYFNLYNDDLMEKETKEWTTSRTYYKSYIKEHSKPSDCIKCGQCEQQCPQHLKIREYLETVTEHFGE